MQSNRIKCHIDVPHLSPLRPDFTAAQLDYKQLQNTDRQAKAEDVFIKAEVHPVLSENTMQCTFNLQNPHKLIHTQPGCHNPSFSIGVLRRWISSNCSWQKQCLPQLSKGISTSHPTLGSKESTIPRVMPSKLLDGMRRLDTYTDQALYQKQTCALQYEAIKL